MAVAERMEWKASRATFHEMEELLNQLAADGWELTHIFSPLSKDQGFTLVHKRHPPAGQRPSRTLGFPG